MQYGLHKAFLAEGATGFDTLQAVELQKITECDYWATGLQ